MEHLDGIPDDGLFALKVGVRHHAAVGHAEELGIAGHLQQRNMGHGTPDADTGLLVHDGLEDGRGLHQSFLQEVRPAVEDEFDGDVRCVLVRAYVYDGRGVYLTAESAAYGKDLVRMADENIAEDTLLRGAEHRFESMPVMRAGDGDGLGFRAADAFAQVFKIVEHSRSPFLCIICRQPRDLRGKRAGSAPGTSPVRSRR